MTLAFATLVQTNNANNQTSYTSASASNVAGDLCIAFVCNTKATTPDLPVVNGWGMTWTQVPNSIAVLAPGGGEQYRLSIWCAKEVSGGSGALGLDYGVNTQTGAHASVIRVTGWLDTGDIDDAFVDSNFDSSTAGSATSASIGFSAPANANNGQIVYVVKDRNESDTANTGDGWVLGHNAGTGNPTFHQSSQWNFGTYDLTDLTSWATGSSWAGVGVEIATASAPQTVTLPMIDQSGVLIAPVTFIPSGLTSRKSKIIVKSQARHRSFRW